MNHLVRRLSRALFVCILLTGAVYADNPAPIHSFKLDNGLQLLVRQDTRAPVATVQVWYGVGGAFEKRGQTGISHMMEHMMFRGTPENPGTTFTDTIGKLGGVQNAFTADDFTAYYEVTHKDDLETCLKLEADRMQNLSVLPEDFSKEHEVVKEERRLRIEDRPEAHMFERFKAVAYTSSPYRSPTIGWMSDIEALNADTVREWHKAWYTPNNAVVVVVGDVEPEQVLKLVKRYFEEIPSKPLPVLPNFSEEPALGTKTMAAALKAQVPMLVIGFHVPSLKTAQNPDDVYALHVIDGVLDGGLSARLETNLVRGQKIAAAVQTQYSPFARGSQLYLICATPAEGVTSTVLEDAILKELSKLSTQAVSDAELKRVKQQVIAQTIYSHDSINDAASDLGMLAINGYPVSLVDELPAKISAVTLAQVKDTAARYFDFNKRIVGELIPQDGLPTAHNGQ